MGWLDGQVALVTGGGSGIGRGIVERFVDEGAQVAALDRSGERVAQLTRDFDGRVLAIEGDVTRLSDNKRAVAETVRAFGGLDVFIGNAGVFDRLQRLEDIQDTVLDTAFDEMFGVNVKGYLLGAKAAMPELQRTGGCMVFTVSAAGFNSGGGGVLYTASKHAVVGLVRQLAAELAPQVRVNGVAPGATMTNIQGLQALGEGGRPRLTGSAYEDLLRRLNHLDFVPQPSNVAGVYVMLASKANSGAITGTVVLADGGENLRWPG